MNSSPEHLSISVDAFHRGRFVVVQPKGTGHRSGIDAMLLAGVVPSGFSGEIADLGAGAGAAGFAVLSRCSLAHVTLVEKDARMIAFARATINHASNQIFSSRVSAIELDVGSAGTVRAASGLIDNHFDFVIMNPPFNLAQDRQTPDRLRAGAHVMVPDMFETWLRTAAATLKARATVAVIARPQSLTDILNAMQGRFGALRIVSIQPRESEPAIRIVVTGIKGSRAALSLEPALLLHGVHGNALLTRADGICNGAHGLFDLSNSTTL